MLVTDMVGIQCGWRPAWDKNDFQLATNRRDFAADLLQEQREAIMHTACDCM
jgi:hypothetical protein